MLHAACCTFHATRCMLHRQAAGFGMAQAAKTKAKVAASKAEEEAKVAKKKEEKTKNKKADAGVAKTDADEIDGLAEAVGRANLGAAVLANAAAWIAAAGAHSVAELEKDDIHGARPLLACRLDACLAGRVCLEALARAPLSAVHCGARRACHEPQSAEDSLEKPQTRARGCCARTGPGPPHSTVEHVDGAGRDLAVSVFNHRRNGRRIPCKLAAGITSQPVQHSREERIMARAIRRRCYGGLFDACDAVHDRPIGLT
jgi:hypothetical protein